MTKLFFELIRVSLGNAGCLSRTPKVKEWQELYAIAKKQSLVGICFAGVQKLQTQRQAPNSWGNEQGELLYLQWMGMAAKIQQRNDVVNRQCMELQKRLKAEGYRSYIMKGQANAALYNVNLNANLNEGGCSDGELGLRSGLGLLRQPGDIDIYLEGGFEKVNEYVQRTYPTKEINELEVHYPCFKDTDVEFHFKPFMMAGPKDRILQRFFDSCKEENFNNTLNISNTSEPITICTPTLKFNLVHQLVHIHHHLFYEGVGLRQLMDYYFVLRKVSEGFKVSGGLNEVTESVEIQEVKKVISDLGLEHFASALMWVIGHVFDPYMLETWILKPETALWIPNEKDGRFLLDEIMMSGNFGKQDERQRGLYDSKWNSFWMVHFKTFRLWRFDHWAWFWGPICRIKGFVWRKMKGYK